MHDSHLVPRLDKDGNHAKDDLGKLAYDEAFGLHPETPDPAPTEGARKSRRPGEEADLPDEKALAKELAAAKATTSALETREKNLAEKERAIKEREATVEKMIADAKKK